jgi:hypothetical protein
MTNYMKLTGTRNQCPGCHEYFNSMSAFTAHRTGKHVGNKRRCLTPFEMSLKGMFVNPDGYWVTEMNTRNFTGEEP